MTVIPLDASATSADVALDRAPLAHEPLAFARALGRAFDAASGALERADAAERAFAGGRGGLQEMVLERAQADVALSLASAATGKAAQALTTILGMQV